MKIYTKKGDCGKTNLSNGQQVYKTNIRIEACGNIDELNSFIGLALTRILDKDIQSKLLKVQNELCS